MRFFAFVLALFLLGSPAHGLAETEGKADAPKLTLQQSLWDGQALAGAEADKTLQDRRPACPKPDCLNPPALAVDTEVLLPKATPIKGSIRSVIPRGGEKLIALTFDLCETAREHAGYDAAIINYLRQQSVKATFYAGGLWMRSHSEKALQLMADPLFEMGNHGWRHRNMRTVNESEAEREVLWTQAEYAALRTQLEGKAKALGLDLPNIPQVPPSYRFPFGTCTAENLKLLEKLKLSALQWSIVTGDPDPSRKAEAIAESVLSQAKPGAIIVAHANGKGWHTAEALLLFIPQLKQRGYRFVTVTELLRSAERVESADTCFETRPGDNARYDKPMRHDQKRQSPHVRPKPL